jgi:branched-chain amino acid transport system substrate-binding protein
MAGRLRFAAFAVAMACMSFWPGNGQAADPIKIANIDPYSGSFAAQGDVGLKVLNYILEGVNAKGVALGRKFELVAFDSKLQPAEALISLKNVIDQNIQFVTHCNGSNVAAALIDGIAKHNARNPENRILYLNCGALATELTNEQCDFWHFRFDGDVGMRAYTLVKSLPKSVTSVYLLNPDYLFGQSIQKDTKKFLNELRPDIKIVGDELVPLGKVKDFSPYIAKIKSSGAQGLITSNFGPDLAQLLKAGTDAGLDIGYYTYLAHVVGGVTAIGAAGENRLHTVAEFNENIPVEIGNVEADAWIQGWRAKHGEIDFFMAPWRTMFEMLALAINKAGTTDTFKVAQALEGLELTDMVGQPSIMRKEDHQLIHPFYEAVLVKGVKYDAEKTGLGWKTGMMANAAELTQPTICKMKRPAS